MWWTDGHDLDGRWQRLGCDGVATRWRWRVDERRRIWEKRGWKGVCVCKRVTALNGLLVGGVFFLNSNNIEVQYAPDLTWGGVIFATFLCFAKIVFHLNSIKLFLYFDPLSQGTNIFIWLCIILALLVWFRLRIITIKMILTNSI